MTCKTTSIVPRRHGRFPTVLALGAALALPALAAPATELPRGLASAELLPGYINAEGAQVAALRLVLEPGWKTYWRSPGDSGIPPQFDWSQSGNLAAATARWPVPEVIDSAGERTLGYHDSLTLPIIITPAKEGQPVKLAVTVDFGLCRDICVPAHLALSATEPPAPAPDPAIAAALAEVPVPQSTGPTCHLTEIEDGMRVTATLPADPPAAPISSGVAPRLAMAEASDPEMPAAAIELGQDGVWVSQPELSRDGGRLTATADLVAPSGKPFPVDPAKLRLTVIADGKAVEYQGCAGS